MARSVGSPKGGFHFLPYWGEVEGRRHFVPSSSQLKWNACGCFVIWLIYLVSTHPDEIYEIFGPSYDGIPNFVTLTVAVAVLIAGRIGMRATTTSR